MPDRKYFATNEEYNAAIKEYRLRNPQKILDIKHKADKKSGYKYQRNWQLSHPERERARGAVRRAVARGDIIKQPCVTCGDENSVAHHPDYDKPIDVVWYCRSHHRAVHYGNTTTEADKNALDAPDAQLEGSDGK